MTSPDLADRLDALLPQTQCTRCGYPDCRGYAQALAAGEAAPNRCPPGGQSGVAKLAALLGVPPLPLNPACGEEGPRLRARIDPQLCIGCTLCIPACPVDAIAGAPKRLHAVLDAWCTGCALCLPPCPVDCIAMIPLADPVEGARTGWDAWSPEQADTARQRYAWHRARRPANSHTEAAAPETIPESARPDHAPTTPSNADAQQAAQRKAAALQAAMAKARRAVGGAAG